MDEQGSSSLFRAAKRRKIVRKPFDMDETEPSATTTTPAQSLVIDTAAIPPTSSDLGNHERVGEADISVSEVLRRRKLAKTRRAGIQFTSSADGQQQTEGEGEDSRSLVPLQSAVETANGRFAPQTGKVADVLDRHMMAYIDSKMAELRHGAPSTETTNDLDHLTNDETAYVPGKAPRERQPAGIGKIQEVDLGPDATLRNIARTEEAKRRLQKGQSAEPMDKETLTPKLGPDGKPWRGRRRKRNSEDIKRDKLVEEVLRESKLEMYEEPSEPSDTEIDQAADDRIAEQFRREFMDAVQSRNFKKSQTKSGTAKSKTDVSQSKGPKLGGSRSARAAMRALDEKNAKKR